ncbi:MAG: hypothetical protein HGB36_14095 [Chlorobiaceae bacterium]|nr:hypothetical protein [Chlorobiaceae bacterium]
MFQPSFHRNRTMGHNQSQPSSAYPNDPPHEELASPAAIEQRPGVRFLKG